ncbi:MAG: hypothetical protein ABIK09_18205 [Pseudomonadota bacterium]
MRRFEIPALVVMALCVGIGGPASADPPGVFYFQGYITDADGAALNGAHAFHALLYDTAAGGTPLWEESHGQVAVSAGFFVLPLGSLQDFDGLFSQEDALFLALTVDGGEELAPRTPLGAVPWAMSAQDAAAAMICDQAAHADSADQVGGLSEDDVAVQADLDAISEELAGLLQELQTQNAELVGQMAALQAQVEALQAGAGGCIDLCEENATGCGGGGVTSWTCVLNEDTGCLVKALSPCPEDQSCVDGACTCSLGGLSLCQGDTLWSADSCGTPMEIIDDCAPLGCAEGACRQWGWRTPPCVVDGDGCTRPGMTLLLEQPTGAPLAIGPDGTTLQWDGAHWLLGDTGSAATLKDLWTWTQGGKTHAYLVGNGGKVLTYNGTIFQPMLTGLYMDLEGLFGFDSEDVYAVGANATILHYDGDSWAPVDLGGDVPWSGRLYDIWGSDPFHVWAVGQSGKAVFFDGATWTLLQLPTSEALYSIWGSGPEDVWIVGKTGTLLHWDGNTWFSQVLGGANLRTVWGLGPDSVWITGDAGTLQHYNGEVWTQVTDLAPWGATDWMAITGHVTGEDEALWLVSAQGRWARFEEGAWHLVSVQADLVTATTVDGAPLIGAQNGLLVEPLGEWWTQGQSGTGADILDFWFVPQTGETLLVGTAGTLMSWTGEAWTVLLPPVLSDLLAVWSDGVHTFIAAEGGALFHSDGEDYLEMETGVDAELRDLFGASLVDLWAVGTGGTILHFDGTEWYLQDVPVATDLLRLAQGPGGALWACGEAGTALVRTGGVWEDVSAGLPEDEDVVGIGFQGGDVIAVTAQGGVHTWDGGNWTLSHPYPGLALTGVATDADGALVVIGGDGVILGQ